MSEVPLAGGDVSVVVRVGKTVRRPLGTWSPGVHALLRWFERVGFDGAPRFLGIDDQGREILSFVDGDAAVPPIPASDEALGCLGQLLRSMHDAQNGFEPPADAVWLHGRARGPIICHQDLFPPNVVFRAGKPVALIDWDLAAPGDAVDDVAACAYHWAPLRTPEWAEEQGLPADRFGQRTRLLCDAYGLPRSERVQLVDRALAHRRRGYALHEELGGRLRLSRWSDMWDAGSGDRILANARWIEEHRSALDRFLA
jgi:hypothetical protein